MEFVKFYKNVQEMKFYKDSHKVHIFLHLLLSAQHEGKMEKFRGKPYFCKNGEFTTGRRQLSHITGVQESKIERTLTEFENEQLIEQRKASTNRIITIKDWDRYNGCEQQNEHPLKKAEQQNEQQKTLINRTIAIGN